VETVNDALNCPAGTVTVAGTVTPALLEERLTTVSAVCTVFSETVPVAFAPPNTPPGFTERLRPRLLGGMTTMRPSEVPPSVAMMLTPVTTVTVEVVTVNVALFDPKGTVTLDGTVAEAGDVPSLLLVLSETISPPALVTKWSSWTVAEVVPPPTT